MPRLHLVSYQVGKCRTACHQGRQVEENSAFGIGEDKRIDGTLYGATILCSGTVAPGTGPPTFCFGGLRLPNTAAAPAQLVAGNGRVIPFQLYGFGSPFPGGPATTPVFLAGSQINLNRKASFEKATWRAGAEWDVGPRSLLYASFEKGKWCTQQDSNLWPSD
jgi:iron complex outermembrane receptor protein